MKAMAVDINFFIQLTREKQLYIKVISGTRGVDRSGGLRMTVYVAKLAKNSTCVQSGRNNRNKKAEMMQYSGVWLLYMVKSIL